MRCKSHTTFKSVVALGASVVALSAVAPVWSHHSFAAVYDSSDPIEIEGTIVQVRLTNPHSWFFVDVAGEDGTVVRWSIEAGTPSGMIRNGYSPNVIKEGDVVTINGFRARDLSKHAGMLTELITADGTVYGMFGPREGSGAR